MLDSSKLKDSADDISNLMKTRRKFSEQEEHNVGKGDIARFEQFLLFLQCF